MDTASLYCYWSITVRLVYWLCKQNNRPQNTNTTTSMHTTSIWRTTNGRYLRQTEQTTVCDSLGQPLRLSTGELLPHCACYVLETPDGVVIQQFTGPIHYCQDDDWGICNLYWVHADTLFEYHWIENAWSNRAELHERICISGLMPVPLPPHAD